MGLFGALYNGIFLGACWALRIQLQCQSPNSITEAAVTLFSIGGWYTVLGSYFGGVLEPAIIVLSACMAFRFFTTEGRTAILTQLDHLRSNITVSPSEFTERVKSWIPNAWVECLQEAFESESKEKQEVSGDEIYENFDYENESAKDKRKSFPEENFFPTDQSVFNGAFGRIYAGVNGRIKDFNQ